MCLYEIHNDETGIYKFNKHMQRYKDRNERIQEKNFSEYELTAAQYRS